MALEWTVARLLDSVRDFLAKKGSETPRLDAEVLLGHVLHKERIYLYTHYDQPVTDTERDVLRSLCKRRALQEPIAYIIGHKEFYGLRFDVSPAVLIPRPETEQLVDLALAHCRRDQHEQKRFRVMDVGTGSGAIAIAIAHQEPRADVVAIEICADALAVARLNAERLGVADRIRFVHAAMATLLSNQVPREVDDQNQFDMIVSNPPYIGIDEKMSLSKSVVDYEPHKALFAGDHGAAFTGDLFAVAARYLAPDGMFAMETAPRHVAALQTATVLSRQMQILDDLAGHARIASLSPAAIAG